MILLFLTIIPSLFWKEGPETAPVLEKAGIHEIVTTGDAGAWSGTKVRATTIDARKVVKLDPPGVDYQLGRSGATSAPWINSNLWRVMKDRGKSFLYEVSGPAVALAAAEAYVSGAPAYFSLKQDDLETFAKAVRFLHEIDGPPLSPRANFGLVDDGSPEIEEVMNLLIRRNLLFVPVRKAGDWKGMVVRIGTPEYTKEVAAEPYQFAAIVRSRIGDDRRLVRIYGSDTTVVQMTGDQRHSRLHLIQYGRGSVSGLRVRVLGRFPRVLIAGLGKRVIAAEDVTMDDSGTEFTIPEFQTYAVIDLDASGQGTLASSRRIRGPSSGVPFRPSPWTGLRSAIRLQSVPRKSARVGARIPCTCSMRARSIGCISSPIRSLTGIRRSFGIGMLPRLSLAPITRRSGSTVSIRCRRRANGWIWISTF
jgi:hypothetical protein